jgi:uncharacterized repeat protein (TIGR03803 family)
MRVTHTPGSAPADGEPTVPRPSSITSMLQGLVMTNTLRFPFTRAAAACLAAAASLWAAPCAAATITPELVYNAPNKIGDPIYAAGPIVQGADGLIYISDTATDQQDCGVIVALDPVTKRFRVLSTKAIGCKPSNTLVRDANGDLWGSTSGSYGDNVRRSLFRIPPFGVPTPVQRLEKLQGGDVPVPWTNGRLLLSGTGDGYQPQINAFDPPDYAQVLFYTQGQSGERVERPYLLKARRDPSTDTALYGLAFSQDDDPSAQTVLVRLDESGVLTELSGVGTCGDITGDLTEGADGNFYVDCYFGGTKAKGIIVRLSPTGEKTTIYGFRGGDLGAYPDGGVLYATDGWLYGSTESGGEHGKGLIYRMRPDGSDYEALYHFAGTDGLGTLGGGIFIQGTDGMVYGRRFRTSRTSGKSLVFRFALPQ